MNTHVYKTGIISLLLLCSQASVHSENLESIYKNPFYEMNKQFEAISNYSPFGDALAYEDIFSSEYETTFTTLDNPNEGGDEPGIGELPAGKIPLGFISCCLLLYGTFCFVRIRKNNSCNGQG